MFCRVRDTPDENLIPSNGRIMKVVAPNGLSYQFLLFQHGDKNLENVTHEEAVATLKATQERVVLIVGKQDSCYAAPPTSISPLPRKCLRKDF